MIGLRTAALGRVLGPVTRQVLNRLLGMNVGAFGVELILEGTRDLFAA